MGASEAGHSGDDVGHTAPGSDADLRHRFEAVALPHLASLYKLAVRLTGSRQDAEDLVQETYVRALVAFAALRQPERAWPWLRQILSRLVIDRYRARPRELLVGDLAEIDRFSLYDHAWDGDPFPYCPERHRDFLEQFDDDEVRGALLTLPEAYRLPLVLLHVEELSYRELAELLGCPLGTVMSRLHRGRKILERELWECAKRRGFVEGRRR